MGSSPVQRISFSASRVSPREVDLMGDSRLSDETGALKDKFLRNDYDVRITD